MARRAFDQIDVHTPHRSVRRRSGRTPRAWGLVVVLGLTASLGGCSTGRSPEKFCAVYREEKQAYLKRMDKANSSLDSSSSDSAAALFGGLGEALSALTDLPHMFDRLDKVAPDDIEPDVAAIRDFLQKQIDSAGDAVQNPGGALIGNLMGSFQVSSSWERVGAYVKDTCHES